jgi:hypothetical protein
MLQFYTLVCKLKKWKLFSGTGGRMSWNVQRYVIEDIKVQVGILSLAVAEKLLKRNFSEDAAQQKLVEELVKDIKLN